MTALTQQRQPQNMAQRPAARPSGFGMVFRPESREEALKFCADLAMEDWVPACYRRKPIFVAIALSYGEKFGLEPLVSLTNIAVINGKPSIYGDMALALARRAFPNMVYKERYFTDRIGCEVTVQRSPKHEPVTEWFDMVRAEQARLLYVAPGKLSGPWHTYPWRMCMFRARGFALRTAFADVLAGFISAEEAYDMPGGQESIDMSRPVNTIGPEAEPERHPDDDKRRTKALKAIRGAKDFDALKEAGREFGCTNPTEQERDMGKAAYLERLAELSPRPPEPDPEPDAAAVPTEEPEAEPQEQTTPWSEGQPLAPPTPEPILTGDNPRNMAEAKRGMAQVRAALERNRPGAAEADATELDGQGPF